MVNEVRETITNALNAIPAPFAGALMSVFIAIFRVVYDQDETKPIRILLESLICGGLTLTAGAAIKALGLNLEWVMFAGGVIGYLGSSKVRDIAMGVLQRKLDDDKI